MNGSVIQVRVAELGFATVRVTTRLNYLLCVRVSV